MFIEARADVGDAGRPAVGLAVVPQFGRLRESRKLLQFEVFAPVNLYDGFRKMLLSRLLYCEKSRFRGPRVPRGR